MIKASKRADLPAEQSISARSTAAFSFCFANGHPAVGAPRAWIELHSVGRALHPFMKEELDLASENSGLGRPRPSPEDQTSLASVRLLKEIGNDGRQPQRNRPAWEYPPGNWPAWEHCPGNLPAWEHPREPESSSYTPSLGYDVRFHVKMKD